MEDPVFYLIFANAPLDGQDLVAQHVSLNTYVLTYSTYEVKYRILISDIYNTCVLTYLPTYVCTTYVCKF